MAGTRDIVVRFLGNASGLNQAANQGGQAVGKFSAKTQKMATVGLAGVAAFGTGLVSMLKGGVEGLREGEEAEAKFSQAMSKVPKAVGASTEAIMAHAEAVQANTRFSYEDALAVSGMLVAQDGVQKAVKAGATSIEDLTSITLDLATAQGKDGPAAAQQLAKWLAAPEKASGALRKAGISLTEAEQAQIKKWTESGKAAQAQGLILDKVKAKTEGAAKAAGETTAGQLDRAKAAWGEVQESLAKQIIPAFTKLVGWLLKVTTWAQDNPGKVKAIVMVLGTLAAVIGTVSAAIKVWTVVTKLQTAATWLMNSALLANPIGLITVAIAAAAAGVVILYKKFDTARYIINGAIKAITTPIFLWVDFVLGNFQKILEGLGHLPKWLGGGKFDDAADAIRKLRAGIKGIRDDIMALPTSAANDFAKALKEVTKQLQSIPKVTNVRIDVQTRNTVAEAGSAGRALAGGQQKAVGGAVVAGRSYMVGERGRERFTPDSDGWITPNHALGGAMSVNIIATGPTLQDIVRVEIGESNRRLRTAVLAGARRS